ncbi:hypothetical protein [Photobacterium piscicola]|nr:hypothetical protein [Photobacterium piscicola]
MINLSKCIRIFCETYKDEIDMQGFRSFPKNSCQGASILLGMMLKEKYPSSQVIYVKGEDTNNYCHYWLEVDGFIFDITADQFDEVELPIYGEISQPLLTKFPILSKTSISKELLISDVTNETYNQFMKMNLNDYLEKNCQSI